MKSKESEGEKKIKNESGLKCATINKTQKEGNVWESR